jgi:uncharacterized C2H2 Zn-finger protein
MEKRSGQTHGIDNILIHEPLGRTLVRCPACPRPFFNMDPAWEEVEKSHRLVRPQGIPLLN